MRCAFCGALPNLLNPSKLYHSLEGGDRSLEDNRPYFVWIEYKIVRYRRGCEAFR